MSPQVSKLKELLFDSEARALGELASRVDAVARDGQRRHEDLVREVDRRSEQERQRHGEIERRIDSVFDRAGTDEKLRTSVASILDSALVQAEVARHDQLAQAIAPLVVRTVRTEIRNSQDVLVEALYPMTGRMVKAYVASAMKDLVADINRRLESNALMLRLKALTTGQSVGELALALAQRLDVEELFLIRRGTGHLIDHWPASARRPERDQVLGGVLAAINDFAAEAFKGEGSSLRRVDLEGSQVYLRASPEYLLAVRCSGTAPRAVEAVIDDEFLGTVERQHEVLASYPAGSSPGTSGSSELLPGLAKRLATRIEEKRSELLAPPFGIQPLRLIGAVAVLALMLTGGWYAWRSLETERVRSVAQRVIDASGEIRGYPVTLEVPPWGRSLTISGLMPSFTAHEDIVSRLRQLLPASEIRDQLAVVPEGAPDARPEIARIERELTLARADFERGVMRRNLERTMRRLELIGPDLEPLRLAHPKEMERVAATVASSLDKLTETRKAVASPALDGKATADQIRAIDGISRDLANAGADVAALIGEASPRVALRSGPNASLAAVVDDLSGETERLSAMVVAVTQADVVNRKPQPAPVVAPPREPTAKEQLIAWLPQHAIFFSNDIQMRQPERAAATLDELAALIKRSDAVIRVVGYTDEAGGPQRNNPLSQQRASRVVEELMARGVSSFRLLTVGGAQQADISNRNGPQSPNRRVEFELAFDGEAE